MVNAIFQDGINIVGHANWCVRRVSMSHLIYTA
nr:MAG TPA: hypothetical protein [Caudoviricetes sp.]